jgi:hypothetical protein
MDKERLNDNKKLAEWVGFRLVDSQWHHPACKCEDRGSNCTCVAGCYWGGGDFSIDPDAPWDTPPDFFTDELANAMLLDKMLAPQLWLEPPPAKAPRLWGCRPDFGQPNDSEYVMAYAKDRKEAIAKAALKWIEVNG